MSVVTWWESARVIETRVKIVTLLRSTFISRTSIPSIKRGYAKVSFVAEAVKIASNPAVAKNKEAIDATREFFVSFSAIRKKNNVEREATKGMMIGIVTIGGTPKISEAAAPNRLTAGQ